MREFLVESSGGEPCSLNSQQWKWKWKWKWKWEVKSDLTESWVSVWQDPLVVSSQQEEDDLAKAIQLSLQENKVTLQLLYL